MNAQADLFLHPVLQIVEDNRARFPDDFIEWLPNNLHIWRAFCHEATLAYRRGYEHYSSRTIVEFLRHHTAVRENSLPGMAFKINDHTIPYLGRLFDLAQPDMAGLFEYRRTTKVVTLDANAA